MDRADAADGQDAVALTPEEFAALIDPLIEAPSDAVAPAGIAVACSGGPDSMALALLTRDWARERGLAARALIVDHGLRAASAREARLTADRLTAAALPARVLAPTAAPARGNLQAGARAMRYRLLAGACRDAGIRHLVLAHHRDDQAETFLMRLARGSGVAGLAAMRPRVAAGGLVLLRPLLDVPRARLAATLEAFGLDAVADPSNRDRRFARVRLRALAPALREAGLTPGRLAGTARRMARAADALDAYAARLFAAAGEPAGRVDPRPYGGLWLDPAVLAAEPEEIRLRVLARALCRVAGRDYPPRLRALERLHDALIAGAGRRADAEPRTLHGCRVMPRDGLILIAREAAGLPAPAPFAGPGMRWDDRFTLSGAAPAGGPIVAPLGADWARRFAGEIGPDAPPREVLAAIPALWRGEAPLHGPPRPDGAGGLRADGFAATFDPGGDVWPLAFSSEPGKPT